MQNETKRIIRQIFSQPAQNTVMLHPAVVCAGYFQGEPQHFVQREGIGENIILHCVAGQGVVIKENTVKIQAGDVIFIPKGTPHTYYASPNNPWSIYWAHYTDPYGDYLAARRQTDRNLLLHTGVQKERIDHFEQLLQALSDPLDPMCAAKCTAILTLLLCSFPTLAKGTGPMDEIRNFIECRCHETLPLQMLAGMANLSVYHFIRTFKQHFGFPPRVYQNKMRIQSACAFLLETDLTVAAISERLGFHSPYYFSEQFKKETGFAPTIYRKRVRLLQ